MKATRKSDGKVIEVTEKSSWNKEKIYTADGIFYRKEELDFNVEGTEEVTIDGWVTRDKSGYLVLHYKKPHRTYWNTMWYSALSQKSLPRDSFSSLTWDSDPLEVIIGIKPKKKQ